MDKVLWPAIIGLILGLLTLLVHQWRIQRDEVTKHLQLLARLNAPSWISNADADAYAVLVTRVSRRLRIWSRIGAVLTPAKERFETAELIVQAAFCDLYALRRQDDEIHPVKLDSMLILTEVYFGNHLERERHLELPEQAFFRDFPTESFLLRTWRRIWRKP